MGGARHAYVDPNDPTHIFLAHEQPSAVRRGGDGGAFGQAPDGVCLVEEEDLVACLAKGLHWYSFSAIDAKH